jgi:hypothetical protein
MPSRPHREFARHQDTPMSLAVLMDVVGEV